MLGSAMLGSAAMTDKREGGHMSLDHAVYKSTASPEAYKRSNLHHVLAMPLLPFRSRPASAALQYVEAFDQAYLTLQLVTMSEKAALCRPALWALSSLHRARRHAI